MRMYKWEQRQIAFTHHYPFITDSLRTAISLMTSGSDENQVCSSSGCNKLGTHQCGRCRNVSYCSTECQKAHYSAHKTNCYKVNLDRTVHRAGNLLQQIFYLFREKMFTEDVQSITRSATRFTIHMDGSQETHATCEGNSSSGSRHVLRCAAANSEEFVHQVLLRCANGKLIDHV